MSDPLMPAMDGHGPSHGGDPGKMAEHEAFMRLVTEAEVTHRAVRDGAWSDPGTWSGGRVPGRDAVVQIGHGHTVTYDLASTVEIEKVRVDGELRFATDRSTRLEVDTLIVTDMGRLEVGRAGDPVRAGVTATIHFTDDGAVGHTGWDPLQLHRGLVSHGSVEMHGAEKTSFVKVAVDPRAGQSSITLEEVPSGWRAGDKVVLTGTKLVPDVRGT